MFFMKSFPSFPKNSVFPLPWSFLIFALLLFFPVSRGQAEDVKRILVVHSGREESHWAQDVTRGVLDVLKDRPLSLETVFMDAFCNPSVEGKIQSGRRIREKILEFKPDVVITVGNHAQIYVTQQFIGPHNPFFVFCGVNGDLEEYGLPAVNVTGVLGRPHFEEAVAFLKTMDSKIKKVAVLSDASPDSMGAYAFLTREHPEGVTVLGYHIIHDFSTWQERVKYYNVYADALFIYLYHSVKRPGTQEILPPHEIIQWTLNHADIPVMGFFNFSVEYGMLGAVGESGYDHGREAGVMALKLINGVPLEHLPVQRMPKIYKMLNLPALRARGMSLPEDQLTGIDWIKQ